MEANVAVVTGGTRGIGRAFSRRLIHLGYRVVAVYCSDDSAAQEARDEFGRVFVAIKADISDPAQVEVLAESVLDELGPPSVLVNNASINIDRPFLELTPDDWHAVLGTNLSGVFFVSRAFVPAMLRSLDRGSIVNVGATTAMRPRRDGVNYCASKAGLVQLTKCLALELAPRIRVNCLIPGVIVTDEMARQFASGIRSREAVIEEIPDGRLGLVEEIADGLEFLVGAQSKYMTGQKLILDGGQFMW